MHCRTFYLVKCAAVRLPDRHSLMASLISSFLSRKKNLRMSVGRLFGRLGFLFSNFVFLLVNKTEINVFVALNRNFSPQRQDNCCSFLIHQKMHTYMSWNKEVEKQSVSDSDKQKKLIIPYLKASKQLSSFNNLNCLLKCFLCQTTQSEQRIQGIKSKAFILAFRINLTEWV